MIDGMNFTGGDSSEFVVDFPGPFNLPPDSSASITIRFCPTKRGVFSATAMIVSEAVEKPIVTLTGTGWQTFATLVATDTVYGRIGDTVLIPLNLLTPLDSADVQQFSVSVQFNPNLLYPVNAVPGTVASDNFSLSYSPADSGCVVIGAGGGALAGTGLLAGIQMEALNCDSTSTPIIITYADFYDSDITVQYVNGYFALDSLCGGSTELLSASGTYALGSIAPNPLTGAALVNYSIAIPAGVRLSLYNILGQEVERLVDAEEIAGAYTAQIRAGDLPPGAYMLVLESGMYRAVRRVVVMK